MAKANLILPDGTKVTIDGNPEEIKKIISLHTVNKDKVEEKDKLNIVKYSKPQVDLKKVKKGKIKPSKVIEEELYRKEKYFQNHKCLLDVEKELNKKGYHFKKGSILMALKGAKYLLKTGGKGSYKFVQKYPPK